MRCKWLNKIVKTADSNKMSRSSKGTVLILIDLKEHTRGGHFGPWLKFFATEFVSRFDRVAIVTPNPNLTRGLFQKDDVKKNDSLSFHKLPWRFKIVLALNYLAKKLASSSEQVTFFLMWGDDLIRLLRIKQDIQWATLSGISRIHRQPGDEKSNSEKALLSIVESDPNCRSFFQPDGYIKNPSSKAIWIPVIEDIQTLSLPTILVEKIKRFRSDKITIGSFGILTGGRCLNALLELARCQPNVNFVIVGKINYRTVDKGLRADLIQGKRCNLFIHPYFLEAEEELNSAIEVVDGIFIDGENYVPHSGIVCKGLHFGKGIISPIGNSWTNDVINEGRGISYNDPTFDLQSKWTEWKNNGGPEKAMQKSAAMRSSLAVKQSFDQLTKSLIR